MAELNTSDRSTGKKIRSKKIKVGVDLTAMVDLAFLLITFFMLTTSLAKQRAMDVSMPVGEELGNVADNRSLTICLGKNNQILWYRGTLENPIEKPAKAVYGKRGIREVLINQSKIVNAITRDTSKRLIVLIKPGEHSNYKNLVEILDEMAIVNINRYAIGDLLPEEKEVMLKQYL